MTASGSSTTKDLVSTDPLQFTDTKPYKDRLTSSIAATGLKDALIVGSGRIDGIPTIVAAMEYAFIGGSMGVVVGEKIARAIERAIDARCPLVIVCCSGGARMMEGALSLMQMAKICGALARLDRARLPYISVLTDPTTGGVTASFAMLGDLNIAEPKALIGFAGPRVIEQTIRQKLPEGFQRSEFLLEKGMIDLVVDRREMKATIASALRFMGARHAAPAAARADGRRRARRRARHAPGRRRAARPVTGRPPALDYLFALEQFGIKFGLENIRTIVDALGQPDRAFHSVHIAGTNGKGSVTAMVDAGAARGRASLGAFHLAAPDRSHRTIRDRRPSGRRIGARGRRRRRARLHRRPDRGRRDLPAQPTFFEVTTAAALELFRRAGVDVAVIEVGLGGRLDSTNVITPRVTAITSIAFDHEQYLGHTLGGDRGGKGRDHQAGGSGRRRAGGR